MRSTFYGLEIAKTGLFTAQTQLDITGHNMSNADTSGYTRQRVVTSAIPPQGGDFLVMADTKTTAGRGVDQMHIEQVRNPFLDYQYRKENGVATEWTTKEQYFGYVEALFNNELEDMELTTGLTTTFQDFYDGLYDLIEGASDKEIRKSVLEGANKLTASMNMYYDRLLEQQDTVNETIRVSVSEINDIASQIALLNKQIHSIEINGTHANDLRDKRNVLLDTLSGIVNIDTTEDNEGRVNVKIGDKHLVQNTTATKLAVVKDVRNNIPGGNELYGVYWTDASGEPIGHEVTITSGAINGYLKVRDGNTSDVAGIPYIVRQLNEICSNLVKTFNTVHNKGWTIPDEHSIYDYERESRNGIDFFDALNNTIEFNMQKITSVNSITWEGTLDRNGTFYIEANTQGVITIYDEKGNVATDYNGNALVPIDLNTLTETPPAGSGIYEIDLTAYGMGTFKINTGGAAINTVATALARDMQKYCYIDEPVNAKNFKVDQEILNNVLNIAVSAMEVNDPDPDVYNKQMNNSDIGHQLTDLIYNEGDDGAGTMNGLFRGMLNSIALEMNHINTTASVELSMKAHLQEQRLSISAVSLDEEMTNMVRFNHSYSAASRMISAIDEQLDKLINGTGMVGR